jgi:predicted SAM-dependent methyltransferase
MAPETPPLRLHLGCGERHLDGYVNIDFPPSEHTVQVTSAADELADITRLQHPVGSVAEIRLHHVFEHFDRPTALRLLADWRRWLARDGELVIETPDFERCARAFARRWPRQRREGVLLRHIFGSHEAAWAVHWDGWYEARYRRTLTALRYGDLRFSREKWQGTHNITVRARPDGSDPSRDELLTAAEQVLRDSLVDDSPSEQRMLAHWRDELRSAEPAASGT